MNCAGVRCRSGLSTASCSGLPCMMFPFLGRTYLNLAGELFRLGPNHRDDQHAVLEQGIFDLNAVSQKEAPLKLPGGDTAMQELPAGIILLPASDDELIVFPHQVELTERESRDRARDQQ